VAYPPSPTYSLTFSTIAGGPRTPSVGDLEWQKSRNLGDQSLSCSISPGEYEESRRTYTKGAKVILSIGTRKVWVGFLDTPGESGGKIALTASGYGTLLDGMTDRLFFQSMDLTKLQPADEFQPEGESGAGVVNPDFTCAVLETEFVRWASKGTGEGGIKGFVAFEAVPIKRFAFTAGTPTPGGPDYYYQVWQVCSAYPYYDGWYRQPGYDGPLTPASGVTVDQTYTDVVVRSGHPASGQPGVVNNVTPYDGIAIVVGGSKVQAAGGIAVIYNVRRNGLISQADSWGIAQLFNYLASRMGWTGAGTGVTNLFPLETEEGDPWSNLTDFASLMEIGSWGVFGLDERDPLNPKSVLNFVPSPDTKDAIGVYEVTQAEGAKIDIETAWDHRNVAKIMWQDLVGNDHLTRDPPGPTQFNADLPYEQHSPVTLRGAFPRTSQVPVTLAANQRAFIKQPVHQGTIETTHVKERWTGRIVPAAVVEPGSPIFVPEREVDRGGGEGDTGLYYVHGVNGTEPTVRFQMGSRGEDIERQMALIERERRRSPKEYL
jgi:hypothetical protein